MSCMAHVLDLAVQGGLKELGNASSTSLCSESEGAKSVKKMKWKSLHKNCLEQFFVDFENLFLRQVAHHKEFISTKNYVRRIKCQIKTY